MKPVYLDRNHIQDYAWFRDASGNSTSSIRYLELKKSELDVYLPITNKKEDKHSLVSAW